MRSTLNRGLCGGLVLLLCFQSAWAALRAPAVPLVTHDPYFAIWSFSDQLTDAETTHWTGVSQPLHSLIRVDGQSYRLMGTQPADTPVLPQTHVVVLPTRTIYAFANDQVEVTLTFLTPALPSDLDVLTRPVTYLTWDVNSNDDRTHQVQLYFDCGAEIAVNTPDQAVVCERSCMDGLVAMRVGSQSQDILGKQGDNMRIDWGYGYVAAPQDQQPMAAIHTAQTSQSSFVSDGALPLSDGDLAARAVNDDAPVLAVSYDLKTVGRRKVTRWLMMAYDDMLGIRYFRSDLKPYWARNHLTIVDGLTMAARDYAPLEYLCKAFDQRLIRDLTAAGGKHYAALCALAYRQTLSGNKIVADAQGRPLMFPKENFSNGCIGTVDVMYPQAPFTLLFSPALTRAMMIPLLDYAQSWRWKFKYAPHDLGTYPYATGQVYGGAEETDENQMPVEETGNMLIIMAGLSQAEGHAELARQYWPLLTQWAEYLVTDGFDPTNQLCTADMFGHLAHNADLSLKAIIGIGGYAYMCDMLGHSDDAEKYAKVAREYAKRWQAMAGDEGHTRLAFDQPGTWGMKHNLIWDRILGLNLFPAELGDEEIAWYRKVQNIYGLPCDNRTNQSLIDWAVWCISLARTSEDWNALFEPLYRYAHETPTRVPLSDWFNTQDATRVGFQARPVVGGIFMRLLADAKARSRWVGEAQQVIGEWAPLPVGVPKVIVVPTSKQQDIVWHYTVEPPASDWMAAEFDASGWQQGLGGIGTSVPGAEAKTAWTTKTIWLRREFDLPETALREPVLMVYYDEAPEIYINGVLAAKRSGYSTGYSEVPISAAARATLKPGRNIMAVHASQTYGGQYIDVGMAQDKD